VPGKVVSEEKAVLFAPVGGRLNEVNVAAGDAVKAGVSSADHDTRTAGKCTAYHTDHDQYDYDSSNNNRCLFAPVGGRLNEVNVAAGDAVKAGDVLMTYDMEQMEERLQEATLQQTVSGFLSDSLQVYPAVLSDKPCNPSAVGPTDVLMTYDMEQMEERLQEATLQQTKSNASYNSTMTENILQFFQISLVIRQLLVQHCQVRVGFV